MCKYSRARFLLLFITIVNMAFFPKLSFAEKQSYNTRGEEQQNLIPDEDTLTVTASGFPQQITDAPATMSIISSKDIEDHSYRTVTDALKNIPGVSIENPASGKLNSQSITIRGMSESYVLFLINGKPLGDSSQAFYNGWGSGQKTDALPPMSAIERIEVIRGPMSSLYGSSASGGVINIITKTVADTWNGNLTLESSRPQDSKSGPGQLGKFYVSGPLIDDQIAFSLYGSSMFRSEDEVNMGFPENRKYTIGGNIDLKINDEQDLGLSINKNHQKYQRTNKSNTDGGIQSHSERLLLNHNLRWNELTETQTYISNEKVSTREINTGNARGAASSYTMANANSRTLFSFGKNNSTLGIDYRLEKMEHDPSRFPGSRITSLKRWDYSVFGENEWLITDELALTLGMRYDQNEKYGAHYTPRAYLVYHLTDALTIKGGVSGGNKNPALKEANSNIVENAARGKAWNKGNDALKPEQSTNYELGAVWELADDIQMGLTTYYTNFRDKIELREICSTPKGQSPGCFYNNAYRQSLRQYVNQDGADLYGTEATMDFVLGEVNTSLNYTYQKSKIKGGVDAGKPFSDLPRQMLNITLGWDINDKLNVWNSTRLRGRTERSRNNMTNPAYMMLDIGLSYRPFEHSKFYTGISNLLDKKISEDSYGKVLDGRSFTFGVTAEF